MAILYLTLIVQKNAFCILRMPGLAQPRSQGLSSLQSFLSHPLASVGWEMREPGTRLEIAKVVCFHKKILNKENFAKDLISVVLRGDKKNRPFGLVAT